MTQKYTCLLPAMGLIASLTISFSTIATAQVVESAPAARPGGGPGGGPGGPGANNGQPRSMTKKAPAGSEPPSSNPRKFAGVWTVESTRNNVLYTLKPEYVVKSPEPKISSFSVPNIGSRQCHPTAYFGQMISVYPLQIVQTDKQLNFVFEENRRTRRIYLGEKLPKNPKPAYFGHSVGHWEGDTLVVETIGTRGLIDFMQIDKPEVRIVERIHKVENNTVLQFDVAYYNDKEWATPGTFTVRYNWRPDLSVMELICEEFSDVYGRGYDTLR